MTLRLKKIGYAELNSRQRENYNFAKLSAVLIDYGFITLRLSDDWQGADPIAQHLDGKTYLRVQLKGRLSFEKKYSGKDLYIAFCHKNEWYIYPHDEVLNKVLSENTIIGSTRSWIEDGCYSFPGLSKQMEKLLKGYN